MHVLMYVYLPYTLSETRYFARGSIFRESEKQTHFRESDVNHVMKRIFMSAPHTVKKISGFRESI